MVETISDQSLTPHRLALTRGPQPPLATSQSTVQIMNRDPDPPKGYNTLGNCLGGSTQNYPGVHPINITSEGQGRMLPRDSNYSAFSSPFRQASGPVQPRTSHWPLPNSSRTISEPNVKRQTSGPPHESNQVLNTAESYSLDRSNGASTRSTMPLYKDVYHQKTPQSLVSRARIPNSQYNPSNLAFVENQHLTALGNSNGRAHVLNAQSKRSESYQAYVKKDQGSNRRSSAPSETQYHSNRYYG